MSIYSPLHQRLAGDSAPTITLSFEEIERVLGRRLPPSARDPRIKRQWWANTDTHVQARAWLKAGRKAKIDPQGEQVEFVAEQTTIQGSQLPGLLPMTQRLIRTTAEKHGVSLPEAMALLLNEAARQDLKETFDWFRRHSKYSPVSSADLIREDRDAR